MFEVNRNRTLVATSCIVLVSLGLANTYWLWWIPSKPKTYETSFHLPDASVLTPVETYEDDPLKRTQRFPKALMVGYPDCEPGVVRNVLKLHPDIRFLSRDTQFWNAKHYLGLKWYKRYMPKSLGREVIVEESLGYIKSRHSFFRMRKILPSMKVIVVIRNPLVSELSKLPSNNKNSTKIISRQSARIMLASMNHQYESYMAELSFILRVFPLNQVLIVDIGTVKKDPQSFMAEVEEFLNLQYIFPRQVLEKREKGNKLCLNKNYVHFKALVKKLNLSPKKFCLTGDTKGDLPSVDKSFRHEFEMVYAQCKEALFFSIGRRFDW